MKKGWWIGCGIAAVLGVALVAGLGFLFCSGIFALTQPVVDASEEFLGLLGQGKIADAYASTAAGFRAQQNETSFTSAVKQLGLTDYASASWHNRQIKNQEGSVDGTVTTKNGGTRPVSVQLVYEGGAWKVVGVRWGGVDLVTIHAPPPVPAAAELRRMATESLLDFNQAVKAKDFTAFYNKLSDVFKKETTPEKLKGAFQEFIDKDLDIGAIKDLSPELEATAGVNDKGVLTVAGRFPTQPSRVRFELQYIHEAAGWKLIRIDVNVGKD